MQRNVIISSYTDDAFTTTGFRSWHKASEVFKKHEKSSSHKDAIYKWSQIVSNTTVFDQVNSEKASDHQLATKCLVEIFTTIQFLALQGIALRGHEELQSNFNLLLLLSLIHI